MITTDPTTIFTQNTFSLALFPIVFSSSLAKNLFTWSMQNVERVNIFGTDFKFGSTWKYDKRLRLSLDMNYSLQKARDISDPDSPTYNNQIAYIPIHTGNIDLSLNYNDLGLRFSNYTNSLRYALNENISNNEVDGFWVSTLSTYYSIKLKNKTRIICFCEALWPQSVDKLQGYGQMQLQ